MRQNRKKIKCQWCEYEFARGATGIGNHMKRKHPEIWALGKDYFGDSVAVKDWPEQMLEELGKIEKDAAKRAGREVILPPGTDGQVDWPIIAAPLEDDPIRPAHYQRNGYEAIDIMLAWFDSDSLLFTVLKYLLRCDSKGKKLEDLRKAKQYLEWAIEREGGKDGR